MWSPTTDRLSTVGAIVKGCAQMMTGAVKLASGGRPWQSLGSVSAPWLIFLHRRRQAPLRVRRYWCTSRSSFTKNLPPSTGEGSDCQKFRQQSDCGNCKEKGSAHLALGSSSRKALSGTRVRRRQLGNRESDFALETNHRGCRLRMPALSRKRSAKVSFIRFPVVRQRMLQVIRSKLVSWWNETRPPAQSSLEPIPMRQREYAFW